MGIDAMRIDGAYNIGPQDLPGKSRGSAKSSKPASADDVASLFSSELKPYIDKAATEPEVNQQAVTEAIRLIRSGQLDTPDAIRRAAQGLLLHGI